MPVMGLTEDGDATTAARPDFKRYGRPRSTRFAPTSASWINRVERWFAELTRKQRQRGAHTSTKQREADIRAFIEKHNQHPKPLKWAKPADDILASVKRFCHRTDQTLRGKL